MACQNGGTFERFWVKKKNTEKKNSYFDCVIDKYFQLKKRQKFRLWALELEASLSVQLVHLQANMECNHVTQSGGYTYSLRSTRRKR